MKNITIETLELIKKEMYNNQGDTMTNDVIDTLEQYGNEWHTYLQNILEHGCISGCVPHLIYFNDTNEYHDKFEAEIDTRIQEYLDSTGENFSELVATFNFDGYDIMQLKNWKAWFAFELACHDVRTELENIIDNQE